MLRALEYGGSHEAAFRAVTAGGVTALVAAAGRSPLLWIDATAPDPDELGTLGDALGWHALVREDLEHRGQRQKAEQFPGHVFAVLRVPSVGSTGQRELHVVHSERAIVTVHDGIDEWIDRLGAEVAHRSDLAAHGAMAAVVTVLASVADRYEESIDELEGLVVRQEAEALSADGDPVPGLRRASATRTAVAEVRRSVGQLREVAGVFVRRELLDTAHSHELDLELRDIADHVVRAHEDLDMLHDRMSALADTRLAMVAYRQNEITKTLSAWAAVLLVPTIVTSWFGQNFRHMVGLDWRYGELFSLGIMATLCLGAWLLLRRARWL